MTDIISRNNERIKEIIALRERNERQEKKRFIFEGVHLTEECIRSGNEPEEIYATAECIAKNEKLFSSIPDNKIYRVTESVYEKITLEKSPQGVLAVCKFPRNIKVSTESDGGCVILESVRDPGNLGGIIRTAASLGIKNAVITSDCADILSPKTVRASMGAVFFENITVTDDTVKTVETIKSKGKRVFAACLYGKTEKLGEINLTESDSVVLGNEGNGITDETAERCTSRIIIPMSGLTESLNVAAASAVIMWEMVRPKVKKDTCNG